MLKKLKLDIMENNKTIDKVENMTNTDPEHLVKSLEAFRQLVNDKLTQKIDDDGNIEDYNIEDELTSSEDEERPSNCGSPKKRKT
uniref:Uncharacterized protein n=1 Tax=Pararge aegeria TaxID=116150 RepID=S4PA41_9NEOP